MKTAAIVIPAIALLAGAAAYLMQGDGGEPPKATVAADEVAAPLTEAIDLVTKAAKVSSAERTALLAQARERIVSLERNHSGDARLAFWRGVADVMAHREADAGAAYARVCALATSGARSSLALYLRAIHVLEFDAEHSAEAVRKLRVVRAQSPEFMAEPVARALFRALVNVHGVQTRAGDDSKAIDSLKEAIRVVGENTELGRIGRRALAYAYGRAGEWPDSERLWQELLSESDGRLGEARYAIAGAYAAQNRWQDAVVEYTAVLALLATERQTPELAAALQEAWLRRGNCRRLLERFDEAKADIEKYLTLVPDDPRAQYWLGVVWNDGFRKPETALELWTRARAAAPWCDSYTRAIVRLYETSLPDPVKAKALRDEMEANAKAHEDERMRRARAGEHAGSICE